MYAKQPRKDLLILEEKPGKFMYFIAAVVLSTLLIGLYKQHMRNYDEFNKLLISFAGFFIVFLVAYRKCRFEFDAAKGKLKWYRKGIFRLKGWSVPLVDIENVIVKSDRDPDGSLGYIVFLITNKGKTPFNVYGTNEKQIRVTYASISKEESERIVNLIRHLLKKKALDMARDGVSELVAAKDYIGAVKLAEQEHGLSLTEAVQHVGKMRNEIK